MRRRKCCQQSRVQIKHFAVHAYNEYVDRFTVITEARDICEWKSFRFFFVSVVENERPNEKQINQRFQRSL